jgi:hypothetical protein
MKITIDIDNRQEVEAAIPLLQLIHGHKFTTGATPDAPVHVTPLQPVAESPTLPPLFTPPAVAQPDPAAIFGSAPAAVPGQDAAAIFASQPATLPAGAAPFVPPTVAPSTAGASPFQTAPEVPQVGAQSAQTGTFPSALPIGGPGSVPMAGATLPANPASGVELDAEGLPWDARIHAGTKRKNADHTWTAKRGLNDAAFVAHVKAELKAMAGGQTAQTAAPAAAPAAPFVPPAAPSLPAQPGASLAPAGPPTTFEQFMARATPACLQQIIPMDAVQKAVTANGLPSVVTLQAHPEYVPQVWAYLVAQYPALGA